jgi:hypothetical protein
VVYDRVAQNPKELTVSRGEFLEVNDYELADLIFFLFSASAIRRIGGNVEMLKTVLAMFRILFYLLFRWIAIIHLDPGRSPIHR